MGLFGKPPVVGIAGETLSFVLNAASETHPREYMGFLRAEPASEVGLDLDGRVITDVLVVPGTTSDTSSARVQTIMQPNATRSVGSVHSHPSGVLRPSDADLATFRRGDIHIIVGKPYEWTDWQAFDSEGEPMELDVLDADLGVDDEDFFGITQADIDRELAAEREGAQAGEEGENSGGGIFSWFRS